MDSKNVPLVSCLCVTHNRVPYLKRAIDCFNNQTYANKELVVVYGEADSDTAEYLKSRIGLNIKCVVVPATTVLTLGERRNLSIQASNGDYFCQWDDDDWYHDQRLEIQMGEAIRNGKDASILVYYLLYNAVTNKAFFSSVGPWPSTILCKKSLIDGQVNYPSINKREDKEFVLRLYETKSVFPVIKPILYIYVYHGSNTWDEAHFNTFFLKSQPLPDTVSDTVRRILHSEIPNHSASALLSGNEFLKELNYFHASRMS
jgi:glycosyltransferase involved in cell wall biosynthesis